MVQSKAGLRAWSTLALCALASAQEVLPSISFGHGDKLSPNRQFIPGWNLAGEGHEPQILSDRVILTPMAPGHVRGALWADSANSESHWSAEATFRVGGQDRGSGNFQIWYINDGKTVAGSNSVYTVPPFEGLVLTVDQHGGRGGMLRGFLNDGSTNYKDHHLVDSLAFGHCDFAYRNLGHSSKVQVVSDSWGLQVKIDDQPCFSSDKISLPAGYYFGMTAATADSPDSFEVNSFIVSKTGAASSPPPPPAENQQAQQPVGQASGGQLPNSPEQLADQDASAIKKQEEQFADVHNRLQGLSHQINSVFAEFEKISKKIDDKHNELVAKQPRSSEEGINALARRIEGLEKSIRDMQKDLAGRDYSTHLSDIHKAVEGVKGGLSDSLPDTLHQLVRGSAPRITTFIFAIIAVQVMLFGVYLVYKKRRDSAPKKYL